MQAERGENSSAPLVVSWSLSWEESLVLEWTSEKEMISCDTWVRKELFRRRFILGEFWRYSHPYNPQCYSCITFAVLCHQEMCYQMAWWLLKCGWDDMKKWRIQEENILTNKNPSRTYKRAIQKILEQKPSLERCDLPQRTLWERYILNHRRIYKLKGKVWKNE